MPSSTAHLPDPASDGRTTRRRRDRLAVPSAAVVIVLAMLFGLWLDDGATPVGGVPTDEFSWGADDVACAVDAARDVVRCYGSEDEMDAAEAEIPAAIAVAGDGEVLASAASCRSWIRLYDNTYYSGKTLYFRDMYWWQNLSSYGFANRAESLKTSDCQVTVASRDYGGGTLRTYRLGYRSYGDLGWHRNRVASIYIAK